jgi:hypothetical protein
MANEANSDKLKSLQDKFLSRYPGGFLNPEIQGIAKKHKIEKIVEFSQEVFTKGEFQEPMLIVENMIKVVSRSSMVSLFEKPKFKAFVLSLSPRDKVALSEGLKKVLHGKEEKGFNAMLDILTLGKQAKWSLITIFAAYYRPDYDVFVKPTTTKGVLAAFNIDEIQYKPRPSWEFYNRYREIINEMKTQVDPSLSPSNAAFCGFLMMTT